MNIKGTIVKINDTVQVTETFKKRDFVIMYAENPQYPEYPKFECINDKCNILDGLTEGQEVDVHFNIKGRPWTNPKGEEVYFNSLQMWKIEAGTQAQPSNTEQLSSDELDDLPFIITLLLTSTFLLQTLPF